MYCKWRNASGLLITCYHYIGVKKFAARWSATKCEISTLNSPSCCHQLVQQLIIIGQRQQLIKCAWIWFLYVLHFLSNKSPRNINNYRISSSRKAQFCGQIKVNNILNLRVIRYDCLPPLFCPLCPPPLGTLRNKNVTFGQKKSGFQGQKQWPAKFHIKFRNTRPPLPLFRKYS